MRGEDMEEKSVVEIETLNEKIQEVRRKNNINDWIIVGLLILLFAVSALAVYIRVF